MAIWTAEKREIEKLLESLGDKFTGLGKEPGNLIKTPPAARVGQIKGRSPFSEPCQKDEPAL